MTTPAHQRRNLRAAVFLYTLILLGFVIETCTPRRDPLLGRWVLDMSTIVPIYCDFLPNGTASLDRSDGSPPKRPGTWEYLPGPYYVREHETIPFPESQLTPADFEAALAPGARRLLPVSAPIRLYRIQGEEESTVHFTLVDGKLISHETGDNYSFAPPATWLDKAWWRLQSLFDTK